MTRPDDEDQDSPPTGWDRASTGPTARQRTGVLHAVRAVLDALVPERAPARTGEPRGPVQRYRSPKGCILQDDAWAVTVSWFQAGTSDDTLGELQVTAWSGVVSRPGATQRGSGGAQAVAELMLYPVERPGERWAWRTADGTLLDTAMIVDRCHAFLAGQAVPPLPVAS